MFSHNSLFDHPRKADIQISLVFSVQKMALELVEKKNTLYRRCLFLFQIYPPLFRFRFKLFFYFLQTENSKREKKQPN